MFLIGRARRKSAQRRGSGAVHVDVGEVEIAGPAPDDQLLALNDALDRLVALEPKQAEWVKLRRPATPATPRIWSQLGRGWLDSDEVNVILRRGCRGKPAITNKTA